MAAPTEIISGPPDSGRHFFFLLTLFPGHSGGPGNAKMEQRIMDALNFAMGKPVADR